MNNQQLNYPWCTEPEIDTQRQEELKMRRAVTSDNERGFYPFKNIVPKLSRADIEWLLVTHENERGPIDWSDEKQRERTGLDLRGADLRRVDLHNLPLARLLGGQPSSNWRHTTKEQDNLAAAHFEGANLNAAHLEGADLNKAHLERADLFGAHLEGAHLYESNLRGADLENVTLGDKKKIGPCLADARLGDTNLALVDWSQIKILGDEYEATLKQYDDGKVKDKATRLYEYRVAIRANRQLAVVLQSQGLYEQATLFAYRAQKLQCAVFRMQGKKVQYLFSMVLDVLAGYGYQLGRTFLWYLGVIFGCTTLYYLLESTTKFHLSFRGALILSITAFHGRGFFPGGFGYDDLVTIVAALEAVLGVFIEISFIATFTQRYFGK